MHKGDRDRIADLMEVMQYNRLRASDPRLLAGEVEKLATALHQVRQVLMHIATEDVDEELDYAMADLRETLA